MVLISTPAVIAVCVFAIWMFLNIIKPLFGNIFLLTYFLFMYANLESGSFLAGFYLFAIIFVLIINLTKQSFRIDDGKIGGVGKRVETGLLRPVFGFLLGLAIFAGMLFLGQRSGQNIIGVPTLAISISLLGPATVAILGIIENKFFFTLYEFLLSAQFRAVVSSVPFIGAFLNIFWISMPIIFTSIVFSSFHLTAFGPYAASNFLFAGVTFVIFIMSYILTKDDTAANTAHWAWNLWASVSKSISLVR